jgi:hypothetical protein
LGGTTFFFNAQLSISSSVDLLASGGSAVVEQSTHNPKLEGSNQTTTGAGERENSWKKVFIC